MKTSPILIDSFKSLEPAVSAAALVRLFEEGSTKSTS